MFQTLIGTVKSYLQKAPTFLLDIEVSNPHRYGQKAWRTSHQVENWPLFQTLIGTVKSRPGKGAEERERLVSNPHRYGQKRWW